MIKRILVPLDGSGLAESAFPYAEQIAMKVGAEVLLLASLHEADSWAGHLVQADKESAPLVKTYLDIKAKELQGKGIAVKTDTTSEAAAEAIVAHVIDENEDLIVMSSHGRSGVTRWVFGSVAHKVLHGACCPILLVRPSSDSAKPIDVPVIGKILVPLDGSGQSLAVLPFIEDFARVFDASLILLTVVLPLTAYVGAAFIIPTSDFLDGQLAWARQFLSGVVKEVQGHGLKATDMVMVGTGASEIVQAADDASADMIALSTHGRSGLSRSLMGSVADAVLHRTTLPCLVVRPPQAKRQA